MGAIRRMAGPLRGMTVASGATGAASTKSDAQHADAQRTSRRFSTAAEGRSAQTRVFTWGHATKGELGHWPLDKDKKGWLGDYRELTPRELLLGHGDNSSVHNALGFVKLAAGLDYTAAITEDGKLYTWGDGTNYKLGHGDTKDVRKPKLVEAFQGIKIVRVSCGDNHTAAVDSEGRLWTWGWGGSLLGGIGGLGHGMSGDVRLPKVVESLLSYGAKVSSASCGEKHTLILTDDGEVLTTGNGEYGRLGNGGSNDHPIPTPVDLFDESIEVVQAVAGHAFNLVLTKNHQVFCWGRNEQGQLGIGGSISMDLYSMESVPLVIEALQDKKIVTLAAGHSHSAAVTEDGDLYMWGMKTYLEPHHFKVGDADEKVEKICCGGMHTAAVTRDGKLYTFGKGGHGVLGHGNLGIGSRYQPHPKLVEALQDRRVLELACGSRHMGVIMD